MRVPQEAPVQPEPETLQVTPLFSESFTRVAVNGEGWPVWTLVADGETETEMGRGAVRVMVAALDLVESATEVARSVTVAGVGRTAGAV